MLYLVPTPLGNLEDITLRALRILREVQYILAEDTRVTRKLLAHHGIDTSLRAYHAHNEHSVTAAVLRDVQAGVPVALVSDAGTPGISDPGFLLVRACLEQELAFTCLPGPTAIVPAIVMSGLPAHHFRFEGFLPQKKGRKTAWQLLSEKTETSVIYESPHRLLRFLEEAVAACGPDRMLSVVREISKIYEEVKTGTASAVLEYYRRSPEKCAGEIVIVLSGKT